MHLIRLFLISCIACMVCGFSAVKTDEEIELVKRVANKDAFSKEYLHGRYVAINAKPTFTEVERNQLNDKATRFVDGYAKDHAGYDLYARSDEGIEVWTKWIPRQSDPEKTDCHMIILNVTDRPFVLTEANVLFIGSARNDGTTAKNGASTFYGTVMPGRTASRRLGPFFVDPGQVADVGFKIVRRKGG